MERRATYWFTVILLAAFCVVGLYFEISNSASDSQKSSLSLHFSWAGISACGSTSPAFEIDSVPADTKQLSFRMTDLNMPSFDHGGSTVAYTGNVVERGAVTYTAHVHRAADATITDGQCKRLTLRAMSSAPVAQKRYFRPNCAPPRASH